MSPAWASRNLLIVTSIACAAAVGVVVILESALSPSGGPQLPIVWWFAYALLVVALLTIHDFVPLRGRVPVNVVLGSMIALSAVLTMLFPQQIWMAALFVLTATTTSFFWRPRSVVILVGGQTTLVAVMGLLGGWSTVDIVMGVLAFGNFQAFGALVVFAARGEAEARRELAIAHAELRATIALLEWTTKEAERLRISRDLHDLAGHDLTALSLELEVASHLTADPSAAVHVGRARSIAKGLLGTVRTAVGEMRTRPISLASALRDLAAGAPGLNVSVDVDDHVDVHDDHVVIVLRCVQEGITNALRHSAATSVNVVVHADENATVVIVSDDGDGVERIEPGNGLRGMRERFEAIGGTLDMQSHRGGGFTITGRLPSAT
jgi:signal transduction histidine kinase